MALEGSTLVYLLPPVWWVAFSSALGFDRVGAQFATWTRRAALTLAVVLVLQASVAAFFGSLIAITPTFRACEVSPTAACLGELAADAIPFWYYWFGSGPEDTGQNLINSGYAAAVLARVPFGRRGDADFAYIEKAMVRADLASRARSPASSGALTCLVPADCLIAAIMLTKGPETSGSEAAVWAAERAAFLKRAQPAPSPELARLLESWSASIAREPAEQRRWHHSRRGELLLSIGLRDLARDSFYEAAAAPGETVSGRVVVHGLVELGEFESALAVARMEPDPDYRAQALLRVATGLAAEAKAPVDTGGLLREIVGTIGAQPRPSLADPFSVLAATAEVASRIGNAKYAKTIASSMESAAERRGEVEVLKAAQAWAWAGDKEAAHRLVAAAIVERGVIKGEVIVDVVNIGPVRDARNDSRGAAKQTAAALLCRLGDTDGSFEVASLAGDYAREAALDIFDCLTDRMGSYPDAAWVASRTGLKSEGPLRVRGAARQVIAGDYDAAAESILAALDSGNGSNTLSRWHDLRNLLKLAIAIRRQDVVARVQAAILSEAHSHSQSEFVKQLADAAAISAAWPN